MGLWRTILDKLGFSPPLAVRDPEATLALTDTARAALAALPAGKGIHIQTVAAERGRLVQITEGESQGPPPEPLSGLPLTLSDKDLLRLRGRTLDYRDGRWSVFVPLDLRARETPNPDGRLYLCDQILSVGRPAFFVASDSNPDLAARLLSVPGVRSVLLRENTVTVEREPDASWESVDKGVDIALREHLLSCGERVDGDLYGGSAGDGGIEDAIRKVIAERILPGIHRDGGDLSLVGYASGVVKVSMVGACRTCPSSAVTLRMGVERTLKEAFPDQIERVEAI